MQGGFYSVQKYMMLTSHQYGRVFVPRK
ncbi:hypothetical protein [Enterocloster clostridioformis]